MDKADYAYSVIEREAQELANLAENVGYEIGEAVSLISSSINVWITGVGKSGLVGQRMAATMTSTGTPAHFLHPTDAVHGDMGAVSWEDIVILISHSGWTNELVHLAKILDERGIVMIAITSDDSSELAALADVHINTYVEAEADEYDLVPSASCINTAAVGDALAITLMKLKNFGPEQFKESHPGGSLGKKLSSV